MFALSKMSVNVHIGNIPYDYTEEQVLDIAKSVGPVQDLKLLFDTTTGKSKGYAFVKYGDPETADSAVRNLNNYSIGNRNLKCSLANDSNPFDSISMADLENLPPLPLGIQIFPNQNTSQVISSILSSLDQATAKQLIKEAKDMSSTNPLLMEKLLDRTPQLAHALIETSLLLNVIKPELVDYCINRPKPEIDRLVPKQINVLKAVKDLTEDDINDLDTSKQQVIHKLKSEINNGSFGDI